MCVRACVEGCCSHRRWSSGLSPAFLQPIISADPPQGFLLQAQAARQWNPHLNICPGGLSPTSSMARIHDKHILRLPGGASLTDQAARTLPPPAAGPSRM